MYWKFKRWNTNSIWVHGIQYFSVVIILFLLVNIMTFQSNFAALKNGNNVDHEDAAFDSEMGNNDFKHNIFQERNIKSHRNQRYLFKKKLWKLLDVMESNVEKMSTYADLKQKILFERYFPGRVIDCDNILNISESNYIASGWTKAVYKGSYKGSPVAVKTVDPKGQDISTCMESKMSYPSCNIKAAKKIVKEMVVLDALADEHVLRVLGVCLPRKTDDHLKVAMVTELGEAVDLIKLLQMSWEDRLKVCLDITRIVHIISKTPYGSMSMNDFRRQQFVLVDGTLKLSDVDDTGFDDPTCVTVGDCDVAFSSANFSQRTKCLHGRCVQFNEKKNIFNAGRHFVTFLLPHGAPQRLQPIINKVVEGFTNLTMSSEQLLNLMIKIVALYQSGWYLNRSKSNHFDSSYKRIERSDLPGKHDYRCRLSLSMATCSVSVFDLQEAESVCNRDDECKGFVISEQRTWTGRRLIHLKNAIDQPSFSPSAALYVKPE